MPEPLDALRDTLMAENERLKSIVTLAVTLVLSPGWAGISDEDVMLEAALRKQGYLG